MNPDEELEWLQREIDRLDRAGRIIIWSGMLSLVVLVLVLLLLT